MNLDILLEERDVGILCLTETWLTDEVKNSESVLNRQFFVQSRKIEKLELAVVRLLLTIQVFVSIKRQKLKQILIFCDVKFIS